MVLFEGTDPSFTVRGSSLKKLYLFGATNCSARPADISGIRRAVHTLKNTAIRLSITFKLAFDSEQNLFSSHRDILQKAVSSDVTRNSLLPRRATSTIQTDVQNAAFCLRTLLQSRSVAPDVANGAAEPLSEFRFAIY
jgi:hypothetical protein